MVDLGLNDVCQSIVPSTYSLRFSPQRLSRSIDWHGHLTFAAWLVELVRPESIVELGKVRISGEILLG